MDALITDTPGLLLALFYADCVPILLVDPARRAVAAAHAGWRGLVAGVIGNTVSALGRAFGTRPDDLLAAIGPCIGACCYEVGDDVAAHFPADVRQPPPGGGRAHIDLAGAATRRARAVGVPAGNITPSGHCTSCLPDRYFSHRRDAGRTGRIGALIGVRT